MRASATPRQTALFPPLKYTYMSPQENSPADLRRSVSPVAEISAPDYFSPFIHTSCPLTDSASLGVRAASKARTE